jgi:hypothetical protein
MLQFIAAFCNRISIIDFDRIDRAFQVDDKASQEILFHDASLIP